MVTDERAAELALGRCRTREAPDDRVAVFDLDATVEDGVVTVAGTVSAPHLRARALAAVERAVDGEVAADVTVLEEAGVERVVAAPKLPCRGSPDPDAEQVTQVVYGQSVTAFDRRDGWRRVRVPDGYVAWVPADELVEPGDAGPDAVVGAGTLSGPGPVDPLYAGVPCERRGLDGDGLRVAFRTGAEATLPPTAVADLPDDPDGEAVVETAAAYLGTDYEWGGMTVDGVDCSGLVWMAYRRNGVLLPRDADQQRTMGRPVDRADLRAGDLLFFPGHVAVSDGGADVVHAEGEAGGVVRASLDPNDEGYSERLDEEFDCARRLL